MRAYLFAFSVLFCIVCAAQGLCATGSAMKLFDKLQKEIKCACNNTSVDGHNSCDCFEIPKNKNCGVTCYQNAFANVNKQSLTGYPKRFLDKTFPNLLRDCSRTCQPCGERIKVNAMVFWEQLKIIFQKIAAGNP